MIIHRKIKFQLFALFVLAASMVLTGCGREEKADSGKIRAAATAFPIYDILRQVGGETIEPLMILPAGASPHTFDPTPAQIAAINKAEIFFVIGAGADDWALSILPTDSQVKIIDLSKSIDLRPFEHEEHEEEEAEHEDEKEHEHGDLDPHYWLDPENAKIIADVIASELALLDSGQAQVYVMKAEGFKVEIDESLLAWQELLSVFSNRQLAVFHDAWGYFAERFGLEIVATFEPFPGKSPSPQYLIAMQEKIKANKVKALFIEPQLSSEAAEALAQELGVEIWQLDPIGGLPGKESYLELIDYNVRAIYGALLASQ